MARQDLNIAVLMHSHGACDARTASSVAEMVLFFAMGKYVAGDHCVKVFHGCGEVIPEVKHRLVGHAFRWEATHLLFVPHNVEVPQDLIQRMLAIDGDIVVTEQGCVFSPAIVFEQLDLPIFHYAQVGDSPAFHSDNYPFIQCATKEGFTVVNSPDLDKMIEAH